MDRTRESGESKTGKGKPNGTKIGEKGEKLTIWQIRSLGFKRNDGSNSIYGNHYFDIQPTERIVLFISKPQNYGFLKIPFKYSLILLIKNDKKEEHDIIIKRFDFSNIQVLSQVLAASLPIFFLKLLGTPRYNQ
jgi:hypothetical protein